MNLTRDLRRVVGKLYSEFGANNEKLTIERVLVLETLRSSGPSSQVSLGTASAIDRSTMSAIVQGLMDSGYATSKRDPDNMRTSIVTITRAGRDALRRVEYNLLKAEEALLSNLLPTQQRALRDALKASGEVDA